MKIWVVQNPRAGSGRATARGRAFSEQVPEAELVPTTRFSSTVQLARRAVHSGVEVLVVVGGDGTLQQCATGLCLDEQGRARVSPTAVLILPAGTGGDYRRTFGLAESVDQAVARLRQPQLVEVDVGRVEYQSTHGLEVVAFLNVLSFGIGGLTDRIVETSPKWIGGKATYLLGAVRATLVHQKTAVELTVDDHVVGTAPFSNVAICLGKYFGSGMKIAPQADPSDGLFDIVTMELGKIRTLSLAAFIYRGTHLQQVGVELYRGSRVRARAHRAASCLVDADGEPMGSLPLDISLMPRALTLYT